MQAASAAQVPSPAQEFTHAVGTAKKEKKKKSKLVAFFKGVSSYLFNSSQFYGPTAKLTIFSDMPLSLDLAVGKLRVTFLISFL